MYVAPKKKKTNEKLGILPEFVNSSLDAEESFTHWHIDEDYITKDL